MRDTVIKAAIRTVLLPLLGAAGALAATMTLAYYFAMCGGSVIGL